VPLAPGADRDRPPLLTGIDVKQTDEPLAYIIRVRGRESADGQRSAAAAPKRIMFTYRPPWTRLTDGSAACSSTSSTPTTCSAPATT
jgi:hypothetical protein